MPETGSGTTPRGEPYTLRELHGALQAARGGGGIDHAFGDDARNVSVALVAEAGGDISVAGHWMTGILLGMELAEARRDR